MIMQARGALFTEIGGGGMSADAYRHSTIQTVWVQNVMLNCA
jgi:hypothetical protein